MKPRQRRAVRIRSIRKRFPIGHVIVCNATLENRARYSFNGVWIVYGYKGQSLKVRRGPAFSGYTATLKELGQ